jgi:DNA-binding beta-propeller fold protein YncE
MKAVGVAVPRRLGAPLALVLLLSSAASSALCSACRGTAATTPDASAGATTLGAPGPVGASIAVVLGGSRVAVANADQGSVSFLDPDSLTVIGTTDVGGEPHALLEVGAAGKTSLLVASYRGGQVVRIDESTGKVMARVNVCAGPYGLAGSPDGTWVAVTCEWDGSVQHLDLQTFEAHAVASGLHRPRAVAILGDDLYVADYIGGGVHQIEPDGTDVTTSLVPASAPYRPALTTMTANLTAAMAPAFGELFIAHVLENNTGDTTLEPEAEDYGTVTSTNPKINPSVTSLGKSVPVLYAEFDGGSRVYSGPSALAAFAGRYLLVAHVSTANVAVLDTLATTPDTRSVGTFTVGSGPSGIAVDDARNAAFVDNALDQSVSRIDLNQHFVSPAESFSATTTLVRSLASPYSVEALAGRRLFFDATNPHVTPAGVVACASCHPGGEDDGLVWFVHTPEVPLKRRRTPHLGNSKTPTAPFHWNGQYATMSDLVTGTITGVMGGDGLLIDTTIVQPYVDEIVKAPVLPVTDSAAVARGDTLFHSSTTLCATCHSGSYLTDDLMHAVLNPMSLHADDVFPQANTPALFGVFLRAPYFHDGRAATLEDTLTAPYAAAMGHAEGLSADQLADLVAYLESL